MRIARSLVAYIAVLAGIDLLPAQQVTAFTDAFRPAGDVGESRSNHTATLLKDGKILVVGGFTVSSGAFRDLKSAVLYDPESGQASGVGDLTTARTDHTATLLEDGHVLVAGGRTNDSGTVKSLASAELYDPLTRAFNSIGNMHQARDWHASVRLVDGTVLVCGGLKNKEGSDSAEIYDPASRSFKKTSSMLLPRLGHSATLLTDSKVLVASETYGELYDAGSGHFSKTGRLKTPRLFHTATLLNDGSVVLVGGVVQNDPVSSAELYMPNTGAFVAVGNLGTPRKSHTATLLSDGRVLIFGGTGPKGTPLSSAELYDPAHHTFSPVPASPTPRTSHAAVGTRNATVFLIGGRSGAKLVLSSVDAFSTRVNQ